MSSKGKLLNFQYSLSWAILSRCTPLFLSSLWSLLSYLPLSSSQCNRFLALRSLPSVLHHLPPALPKKNTDGGKICYYCWKFQQNALSILPSLSSSILFIVPLMVCACFINIPINNNPESYLFLSQWWHLLVTCTANRKGPFSWRKRRLIILVCQSAFFAILPRGDWLGVRLGYWGPRLSNLTPETKQDVFSAHMTIFFSILRFIFLLCFIFHKAQLGDSTDCPIGTDFSFVLFGSSSRSP